jgi:transaldolase
MAQKTYSSHLQLLSDKRWQALAGFGARPQRVLWASTSTKDPDLPDTYYLGRQAAPDTIDTVAEGRCSHSPIMAAWTRVGGGGGAGHRGDSRRRDRRRHPPERLQREGAGRFSGDWAALLPR